MTSRRLRRTFATLLGTMSLVFGSACQSDVQLATRAGAMPPADASQNNQHTQNTPSHQAGSVSAVSNNQATLTPIAAIDANDASGLSLPPRNVTAPPQGVTAPPQGITAPPQGITAPPQGITAPPQGFTIVQARIEPESFQTQGFHTQADAGKYYLKLNSQLVPQNFTATPDGGHELSTLVSSSILASGDFRVEAGQQGGQAREYLFRLSGEPLVRLTLRLFPHAKRQGELGVQTSLNAALTQQQSLNLPDLISGLQGISDCLNASLGVNRLSLEADGSDQLLSWEGTGHVFTVRVDGAVLGETVSHSMRLHLSGQHQISVQPRLDGCLLPPVAAVLSFNGASPSASPIPGPTATPSPAPSASSSGDGSSEGPGLNLGLGASLGL